LTVLLGGHIFKTATVFIRNASVGQQLGTEMSVIPPNPDDPGAPVHEPSAGPAPAADDVRRMLAGVIDPELHVSIVDLGMVDDVLVGSDGDVRVTVALTTAGCPLRGQIKSEIESKVRGLPGVHSVAVEYGEMTPEQKSAAMQRARWQAREHAAPTEVPATTRVLAIASGKGGVGKSSVTVNLAGALAARGLTVGVLDADIWGFSVPRMLGVDGRLGGTDGKIEPNTLEVANLSDPAAAPGMLKVISMGFLVEDEATALMWRGLILTKAVEQFLHDVRWGEMDYLLIDLPPGTGDIQMGLARMLPQTEMLVVTTPAVAAQQVAARAADMARRSFLKIVGIIENMSEFVTPTGERFAVFGRGGGDALAAAVGVPLVARIPLEPEVSAGGDAGHPIAIATPDSPAGAAFHELADRIVRELAPPIEMAGCTARILDLVADLAPKP
jgi:ATP-binding protein involved in chromosome partitioning